jgi:sugar lactone lactonase YvrE
VQRFGDGFIVAGYDNGRINLLDPQGNKTFEIRADDKGRPLVGPNDIAPDGHGGAHVSLSGPWETAPIVGRVAHVRPDGQIKVLADDIHYANGLALSADGSRLFVNESEAGRVIQFKVGQDGALSDRNLFVRLTDLNEPVGAYPDGIKRGPDGNLYIGLFSAGRILVVTEDGKLVRKIEVPSVAAPDLSFSADGKTMYVMAVDDPKNPPYPGKVYELRNE